jgi:hypothetical protein
MNARIPIVTLLSWFVSGTAAPAAAAWEPYVAVDWTDSAEFEDAAGRSSVETLRWTVGATGFMRSSAGQLLVDGSVARTDADWDGDGWLVGPGNRLYDAVEQVSLSAMWTGLPHEQWGYSVMLGSSVKRSRDGFWGRAGFSDSLTHRVGLSVNYRVHRGLVFGAGVFYRTLPAEMDSEWYPIVQVYWEINDKWTLNTRNGILLSRSSDNGGELTLSALWESPNWHLGRDGSLEMGYEEEGIVLGAAYKFEPAPGFSLEPGVEYLLAREATVRQDGRRIAKSDLEDTFRISLRAGYQF